MLEHHGRDTVICVPLLLPSGSWFALDLYVYPLAVMPLTENCTLAVFVDMRVLLIVHKPLALVVQLTVPLPPQLPVTSAPATAR